MRTRTAGLWTLEAKHDWWPALPTVCRCAAGASVRAFIDDLAAPAQRGRRVEPTPATPAVLALSAAPRTAGVLVADAVAVVGVPVAGRAFWPPPQPVTEPTVSVQMRAASRSRPHAHQEIPQFCGRTWVSWTAAMAAVLSPTLVGSTLAILTITAAAQDRDQIEVPVGADLYLTRTFDPAKLIFGGRGQRVRASRRPAARAP
jgi:hypothetical protein